MAMPSILVGFITYNKKVFNNAYSVITYDYSGYGLSEGQVSEAQVYNDVRAVYDYLIKQRKLMPEQIMSYGHSGIPHSTAFWPALKTFVAGLSP